MEEPRPARTARSDAERTMRELLRAAEIPEPDEVLPHDDGIVCLWHEQKFAIVVDLEDRSLPPVPPAAIPPA